MRDPDAVCPQCGGPVAERQAHPYPVLSQVLFGASFLVFLFQSDRLRAHPPWLWGWTAVQVILGVWLVWGRARSKRRVLRCIRCSTDLP